MLADITDMLIISTPQDTPRIESLFGDGSRLGLNFSYIVQEEPKGIAQAFILGAEFIGDNDVMLILGDNIFYGVADFIRRTHSFSGGALVFGYLVKDPERYGVVEFGDDGRAISIEEKPSRPRSNYAVTGLYLYDSEVVEIARNLKPSARGELEITDVNRTYLEKGRLQVVNLGRGIAWLDTGTPESMLDAGEFIAIIEKRQGLKIACLEEIAYRMRFINRNQMESILSSMGNNTYRDYLVGVVQETDGG
jgi:glucose-1-phosphate thymidylyltransferase